MKWNKSIFAGIVLVLVVLSVSTACIDETVPIPTGQQPEVCLFLSNGTSPIEGATCLARIYNNSNFINYTMTEKGGGLYRFNVSNNWTAGEYTVVYNCSSATVEDAGSTVITLYNKTYIQHSEEDKMAGLAVTVFVLLISGTLFGLGAKKKLVNNVFLNLIIKRSLWVVAIFTMMLNSAIMWSIADQAGLGIGNHMERFMLIFGWAGYTALLFLMIATFVQIIQMARRKKLEDRGVL